MGEGSRELLGRGRPRSKTWRAAGARRVGGWAVPVPGVDGRLADGFALRLAVRCEVRLLGLDQLNRGSVSPIRFSNLR